MCVVEPEGYAISFSPNRGKLIRRYPAAKDIDWINNELMSDPLSARLKIQSEGRHLLANTFSWQHAKFNKHFITFDHWPALYVGEVDNW